MLDQVGNQSVGFLMTRLICSSHLCRNAEKPIFRGFTLAGYKPTCVATVARFEIMDLENGALFEQRHEKTNVLVSNLVQHKPGCTATEDG